LSELSFEEAVCWAFDLVPSRLSVLYFTSSYHDLKVKIRLRSGFEQVKISASFQVMSEILSAAFGGSDSKTKANPNHTAYTPKNNREAKAMLSKVLNGR
jgi:hypothetical protein